MSDEPMESRDRRCGLCRWAALWVHPYGTVEHFCSRRQETLSALQLNDTRCVDFER